MEIRNNQTVRNVQLLLILLSRVRGGDLPSLVVAPALIELIIPLLVEEEIFALLRLAGLAELEELHVSKLPGVASE